MHFVGSGGHASEPICYGAVIGSPFPLDLSGSFDGQCGDPLHLVGGELATDVLALHQLKLALDGVPGRRLLHRGDVAA